MSEKSHSIESVIRFLESARDRGAMKANTARTRRTAIKQIKEYLTSEEQSDLRKVDLESLAKRIREQSDIQEGTIQTYLTRLRKTIDAYNVLSINVKDERSANNIGIQQSLFSFEHQSKETLAIVLDGLIVRISNLPTDLTMAEAEKICSALRNYANKDIN